VFVPQNYFFASLIFGLKMRLQELSKDTTLVYFTNAEATTQSCACITDKKAK